MSRKGSPGTRSILSDPKHDSQVIARFINMVMQSGKKSVAEKIDQQGALDFTYAADTIGGNSGSPVIDRDGNVIGANFDRNIHGLRNDYAYDMTMARSIGVSTAAIEQALKVIYPAPALLAELRRN